MRVSVVFAARLLALCVVVAGPFTSCHTSSRPKKDPHQPMSFMERTSTRKGDVNKKSQFDKMLASSALGDRGAMKAVGRKSFGTADYKGKTQYSGSKDYKTKDFAQAGKPSRAQNQMSSFANKKSNSADKTFATNDSRWSGKAAQGNGKVFNGSNQQYKTGEYEAAAKSLKSDKRPYFQSATDLDKARTYPEEEVRALLNRN